jgi:hypothetical protein
MSAMLLDSRGRAVRAPVVATNFADSVGKILLVQSAGTVESRRDRPTNCVRSADTIFWAASRFFVGRMGWSGTPFISMRVRA